ncbi:MAG TPA: DUF1844 domain-containing protein [Terriglobales bacterium]|nr:DUF1844 domain-containing protein [Terriglobales bacterium]
MAEKKQEGFTVTDRRLFTPEGEVRKEVSQEEVSVSARTEPASVSKPAAPIPPEADAPPIPSSAEQKEQADAYRKSTRENDHRFGLNGQLANDLEISFERFTASLYMTAMLQLGLMHEQGAEPRIDLIGARQTIDTLSLLSDKTKGNLSSREQSFLQNSLYELRMAYVDVTNALSRPQQAAGTGPVKR